MGGGGWGGKNEPKPRRESERNTSTGFKKKTRDGGKKESGKKTGLAWGGPRGKTTNFQTSTKSKACGWKARKNTNHLFKGESPHKRIVGEGGGEKSQGGGRGRSKE